MNYYNYWKAAKLGINVFEYSKKCREIQKSLKYNPDPNATVRHHLRDTEEQRKYNDEHYELWGFEIDENGNDHFEYGKYIIFITPKEHTEIHRYSEETRIKISKSNIKFWNDHPWRRIEQSIKYSGENNHNYGKHFSVEHREKISKSNKARWNDELRELYRINNSGENNPNYGKHPTNETRLKLSEAAKNQWQDESIRNKMVTSHIGKQHTEETKKKLSESKLGEKNPMWGVHNTGEKAPMYGKKHSDETKIKMKEIHSAQMKAVSLAYKEHKENGGNLSWNEFQIYYSKMIK